jgi:hypothetical protein
VLFSFKKCCSTYPTQNNLNYYSCSALLKFNDV